MFIEFNGCIINTSHITNIFCKKLEGEYQIVCIYAIDPFYTESEIFTVDEEQLFYKRWDELKKLLLISNLKQAPR